MEHPSKQLLHLPYGRFLSAFYQRRRISSRRPERGLSRKLALLKVLLGWLYVGIPHGIALFIYGIAVTVAVFISAWSVLLFGRYPRTLFDFNLGFLRWSARVDAYLTLLRDEYPPFHGRA